MRRTLLVHNQYARRIERFACAQRNEIGATIVTIEQLAMRLAGGLIESIDRETLQDAMRVALENDLGELEAIKQLPGFQRTAIDTLSKAWRAGINLYEPLNASAQPRFTALAALEAGILTALPRRMLRPHELVQRALARITFAPSVVGSLEIHGHTELEPVWRPLLQKLAALINVTWIAGPRHIPTWVRDSNIPIVQTEATAPTVQAEICANPHHEVLEALRWARGLLGTGKVRPQDIAITSAALEEWDDHVAVLREIGDIPLHLVMGLRALDTLEGQVVMAVADVLLDGFSRNRVVRLIELLRLEQNQRFGALPDAWFAGLPDGIPLDNRAQWDHILPKLQSQLDSGAIQIIEVVLNEIHYSIEEPTKSIQRLLGTRSEILWNRALARAPLQGMAATLQSLRIPDSRYPPETSIIWAPAAALASAPRAHVRLIGLHAGSWPRAAKEDALLPDHVVPRNILEPLPLHEADRRDFASILATTTREIIMSCASRNAAGKHLGISPLYPLDLPRTIHNRTRIPHSAASGSDRLFARPEEFAQLPMACRAAQCWSNWNQEVITEHDGLMPENHPLVLRALQRRHSASSLKMLLCNPLGYLWKYGFRWSAPQPTGRVLRMDAAVFGSLLHAVLEATVMTLEHRAVQNKTAFADVGEGVVQAVLRAKLEEVGQRWEREHPVPPAKIWRATLDEIAVLAYRALTYQESCLEGQRTWAEIPFGAQISTTSTQSHATRLPWDPQQAVQIPQTSLWIGGIIDRLDLSADGSIARVTDYKSGQPPKKNDLVLDGGLELQRVLYACAVVQLLPQVSHVQARLLYPRADQGGKCGLYELTDTSDALYQLSSYLREAQLHASLGHTIIGRIEAGVVDPMQRFALPSGALNWYYARKKPALKALLGELPQLWEVQ